MPRDIPVGNGNLLVAFDQDYCLRDIYYPHVGKENHTDGHSFRFGIWVEGKFEWVCREWNLKLDYVTESLLTQVTAFHEKIGISLHCNDLIDYRENIYIKKIILKNLFEREREVRIFFHHDYHILESANGDTAYYDPDEKALIHYKGNRYFLMSGIRQNRQGIDQYATGIKEFHGLEGTWKDAEDGRLEGAPISQGSVDSTLSFSVNVFPNEEQTIYYWMCAGENYAEVSRLNKMIMGHGIEYFIKRTENYWRAWVNKENLDILNLPENIAALYKKSLLILRTNINSNGAIIAGNDSDVQHFARDTYSYMWPRDGALVAYALDMAGYHGITRMFFDFCLNIIGQGKESVGYFLHKYNPNGSLGSSWHPWVSNGEKHLPIQEDGTGLILWALWFHFDKFRDIEFAAEQYENLVIRCGDFLASYRDKTGLPLPSYDLWEEKWGIHTFTVSAVYAGLKAAENFTNFFGDRKREKIYKRAADEIKAGMNKYLYSNKHKRFLKAIIPKTNGPFEIDHTIDASIYAPFYFGVFEPDDERVANTMYAIKNRLWVKTDVGGIARYEGDKYHSVTDDINNVPGNPWFICTLWLAQWYIAKAKNMKELEEAIPILQWAASRVLPSGVLAEQVHPFTNQPLSVSPLTWSHAAFVATALEYMNKLEKIDICPECGSPMHSDSHRGKYSHRKE
ncbi:MAG: glycoside hydrolase family 15 protein [Nitrospirae bacterium]|nr:glycoside hydrolase family 15 protein [Nitrospirota bacterium]